MDRVGLARTLFTAVVVFVTTNLDDLVILSVLFADRRLSPRSIVLGQFAGIGALFGVSALAGLGALAIPARWPALLGVVPLALGLWKAGEAFARVKEGGADAEPLPAMSGRSAMLAVAGVTIANGGDNLGVYVPLFAAERRGPALAAYGAVFAVMTGLWCLAGYKLVHNLALADRLCRWGRVALPIVLVGVGLHVLSGLWR